MASHPPLILCQAESSLERRNTQTPTTHVFVVILVSAAPFTVHRDRLVATLATEAEIRAAVATGLGVERDGGHLVCGRAHTEGVGELNPAELHVEQ